MPEETNDVSQQREAASSPNFGALEEAFGDTVIAEQIKTETAPETSEETQAQTTEQKTENVETPEVESEKKEETTEEKEQVTNTEDKAPEEVVLKLDDVTGFETDPEDGTWLAVAKARGLSLEEDSYEAYVAAEDANKQAEIEQIKAITKEAIFSSLKPETAAALRLIESGWDQEKVFAPTKEIDSYLSLTNEELLRADMRLQNWPEDRIDTEMEILAEKNWVKHEADKLRDVLTQSKENIIAERDTVLSQYSQLQERAAIQKREQEIATIRDGIRSVPTFMNARIDDGAKEAVTSKYLKGEYDAYLNDPKSKIDLILFKEFGEKAIKHLERTSFEKGRETITKKLSNIPPVQSQTANKVVEKNQIRGPLDAFNDFE